MVFIKLWRRTLWLIQGVFFSTDLKNHEFQTAKLRNSLNHALSTYIKSACSYKTEINIEILNKITLFLAVNLKGLLVQKRGLSEWGKIISVIFII